MNPEQVTKILADGLREIMGQRIEQTPPGPHDPGLAWVRDNADSVANNLERRLFARFEAHVRSQQAGQQQAGQ